jgi:hypothetical protein
MHHRRSRNPRRECKRIDTKAYRQAEARALEKGVADNPPQDSWHYKAEPLPLGDAPCNGKAHGKKKARKTKDKCPVNRVHEWYTEWSIKDYEYRLWNDKVIRWTERVQEKTCIHCWKAKLIRVREDRYGWRYARNVRKPTYPKRPVKF